MPTNRNLYTDINSLLCDPALSTNRALEDYLRALLGLCREHQDAVTLTADQFVDLLKRAFVAEPLGYDQDWPLSYVNDAGKLTGFANFRAVLLQQIVDLHEMREAGILSGNWIGLGVDAPRGGRWYNFEPGQYLECAAAGSLGGWEPGDPGGRDFVPGLVAVQDAAGNITSADPRALQRPIYPIPNVSWEQFADFLYCGQIYE